MTNHTRRAQRRNQQQAQFPHRQRKPVGGAPLAASALALALGGSVQAATFTVTNTFDGGEGSLRAAVAAANANLGTDTINFTLTTPATINLTTGDLTITDSVTITGPGADVLTISGGGVSRIFAIDGPEGGGLEAALSGMTLTNGVATGPPSFGGAIVSYGANLDVTATTITGNVAGNTATANEVIGYGGGILLVNGNLTITNSTISGNVAGNTGTSDSVIGLGGGIFLANSNLTITNSTISGNVAGNTGTASTAGGLGGGILSFFGSGAMLLESSTVANNTASFDGGEGYGGGLAVLSSGAATLHNTIVAGNTGAPQYSDLADSNNNPFLTTYSLVRAPGAASLDDSAAPGSNVLSLDPLLGPLQNNGGPTKTQALLAGSPAIDQGDPNSCQPTDQRGVSRPIGSACDIGAVESSLFNFTGFFQPVDNSPAFNQVKAGQSIPVKFSLGGNFGLHILAAGAPTSQLVACDSNAPLDDIEQTVTAGRSRLTYDAATNQYTYVWKTQKAWAGTCRQLNVTLTDGTVHSALFKLK